MAEYKCAFNSPLVAEQFGCELAMPVTRRGGPDIACASEEAHRRCQAIMQHMKAAALPVFGVEDDPLTMPHSVLLKTQFGGLLGLQHMIDVAAEGTEVKNINALLGRALAQYGNLEAIPYGQLVDAITGHHLKRRRAK